MRRLAGCVLLLALAGCTDDPAASPPRGVAPTAVPETAEPPTTEPTTTEPPTTEPLVIAGNPRRARLELTERQARRMVRGTIPAGVELVPAHEVGPDVRAATVDGVDPLRDPAAYPLQVPGPAPGKVTTLTVVGDIMLGRGVTGRPALAPMADRLAGADITVGNLESTLARLGPANPVQGDPFDADPTVRRDLRAAGFDALSLANNHTGDFGDASLVRTVDLLRTGGLPPFGAGRDLADARAPVVVRRHGVRFGFVGFNAIGETPEAEPGRPGALSVSMPPRTGPFDRAELARVLADVRRLARRVDVVVVMPHWGTQYTHRPDEIQHRVGRELVAAGADLVVGGHPHWVQGAEQVGDALVVHSLGNFVFDMDFMTQTMEGLVLEATFWGDRLVAADFVPYRIGADFAPRVVPRADAASILDPFWEFSSLAATR